MIKIYCFFRQIAKNRPVLENDILKYNYLIKLNLLALSLLRIIPNNYKLLSKLPNFRYLFSHCYRLDLPFQNRMAELPDPVNGH